MNILTVFSIVCCGYIYVVDYRIVAVIIILCSENEILREGNVSLEILRDKLKTRVSDLEELRRLRDELEQSISNKEMKSANDEVTTSELVLHC